MKKNVLIKGITWALIFSLFLPVIPSGKVWAKETYTDPMTGNIYEDFPPVELLQGKSRKDQSNILQQWLKLSSNVKEAYRQYLECKKSLAEAEKNLARAKAEKSIKEVEYQSAVEYLKRLLVKAMLRLGIATGVIAVDAAANAYLAGKEIKEAIKGDKKGSTTPEEIQAQKAEAAEAQRLTSEAAKREQYVASLQKSLEEAQARVSKAKANKAVASRPGPSGQGATTGGGSLKPPVIPQRNFNTKKMLSGKDTWDDVYGVKYYSVGERQEFLVKVKDGKFYDAKGNLLDTRHAVGSHGYSGRGIFVMDKQGNIYLHTDPIQGKIHHSSLVAGGEVAGAGQMRIEDGVLKNLDPTSGHYPFSDLLGQVIQRLEDFGVAPSTYRVDPFK